MSWPTRVRSGDGDADIVPVEEWAAPGELVEDDYYEITWETRVLSHRDAESLGMWAASLKLMGGTQDLLPTVPLASPYTRRRSRDHSLCHPHSYPLGPRPSAPPASPRQPLPASVFLARDDSARGIIHEASAACNKIMQLACSLERRTNAERRLSRKNRRPNLSSQAAVGRAAPASTPSAVVDSRRRTATPRPPCPPPADSIYPSQLASAVHPAAASRVSAVGDDSFGRAATLHTSHPLAPDALHLVGFLSDTIPATAQSPPSTCPPHTPPLRTFVDVGTQSIQPPTFCDAAVDTSTLCAFTDASVGTSDAADDCATTYGVIRDPFVRALARLVPRDFARERKFTQSIYLDDWLTWAEWFDSEHLPAVQRVYLNEFISTRSLKCFDRGLIPTTIPQLHYISTLSTTFSLTGGVATMQSHILHDPPNLIHVSDIPGFLMRNYMGGFRSTAGGL